VKRSSMGSRIKERREVETRRSLQEDNEVSTVRRVVGRS